MNFETWLMLLLTCGGGSLIPGPNAILVLNHVTVHGFSKTLSTIAGGVIGFILLIGVCVFGLGSIIQAEPKLMMVVKIIGGLYLAWLGLKLWMAPPMTFREHNHTNTGHRSDLFRQGFLSAATNPKGMMFFTAVLPQFLSPRHSMVLQFVIIALTLAFTEFCVEMTFALVGDRVKNWIARSGKRFNRICGTIFFLFAIVLQLRE